MIINLNARILQQHPSVNRKTDFDVESDKLADYRMKYCYFVICEIFIVGLVQFDASATFVKNIFRRLCH